ncbi:MAG: EAL domain-containing protein [Psychrobium sp.]|nr:EAL domain-containing protein [Psychrobium sp.]
MNNCTAVLSEVVFNNTHCGLLVVDADFNVISANQWFLSAASLEIEKIERQSIFELFSFAKPQGLKRCIHDACRFGLSSIMSNSLHPKLFPLYSRFAKNGDVMDQLCTIKSIKHEGTRLCLLQIQDVTDSSTRERFLSATTETLTMFSLAVQHSPSSVVITDAKGVIEYVNPKFTEISGYLSSEAKGQSYFKLFSGNDEGVFQRNVWQLLECGQEWVGERCLKRQSGDKYWAKEHIYPILSNECIVTHFVAMQDDITQFKNITRKVSYQATHDDLTGLLNRQAFENILRDTVDRIGDNEQHVLCFLDIDQFKIVNDTCGHVAGDELLRQLAVMFSGLFVNGETLARLGGDEFAVVLYGHSLATAKVICENLIERVADFRFRWEENVFGQGISVGMTEVTSHTTSSIEAIKQADSACYAAKDAGRNRVHIYQDAEDILVQRQGDTYWATRINEALENNRLVLYAQPIVPLQSDRKSSYEILVRMLVSDGGIIPPGLFLPAGERFNLSHRIDKWVIDATIDWMNKNTNEIGHIDHISINLSGISLGNEALLSHIISVIESSSIEPGKLAFEITETAAIANLTHANHFISTLREYGCKFALDDFGSGLSSFAYLKHLKVDMLKIDGMFVKDMLNDPIDEAMVRSINDVGHVIGMETIAEFVEDDAICQRLKEIGVDYGQGYGLGKPVPIDQILVDSVAIA